MPGAVVDLVAPNAGVRAVACAATRVEVESAHARIIRPTVHRAPILTRQSEI